MAKETFIMKNSFLTDDDMELFEPEEIGYLMIAWSKYINKGELPDKNTLAKHLIVKFNQWKEFYLVNQAKYDKKVESIERARESNRNNNQTEIKLKLDSNQTENSSVSESVSVSVIDIKEKEDTNVSSKEKTATKFVPPTKEQVREYCQERENNVDPENFVDFYTGKGWMIGKNKMKDWKAAVRTWERNNRDRAGPIRPYTRNHEAELREMMVKAREEDLRDEQTRRNRVAQLPV